jgi:hypothetical protein
MKKLIITNLGIMLLLLLFSCETVDQNIEEELNADIPEDPPEITLPNPTFNNIEPSASVSASSMNDKRLQLNILDLRHPQTNMPIKLNYNSDQPELSNIFIAEDGLIKGLKISQANPENVKVIDIVFAVDNSASMEQENDIIAPNIIDFANFLLNSGLDVRFAVVGYVARVSGALNFTDLNTLTEFLTKGWGVERTRGFGGHDSTALANNSYLFADGTDAPTVQNGIVGILFADTYFNWRTNASRVFINFTDDGIHSNGEKWNIEHLCRSIAGKATVHSVFSQDTSLVAWSNLVEKPWQMSECTGGSSLFVQPNQNLLNLASLPVTQVLKNSYKIEFRKNDDNVSERVIELMIRTSGADGYKQFNVTY